MKRSWLCYLPSEVLILHVEDLLLFTHPLLFFLVCMHSTFFGFPPLLLCGIMYPMSRFHSFSTAFPLSLPPFTIIVLCLCPFHVVGTEDLKAECPRSSTFLCSVPNEHILSTASMTNGNTCRSGQTKANILREKERLWRVWAFLHNHLFSQEIIC